MFFQAFNFVDSLSLPYNNNKQKKASKGKQATTPRASQDKARKLSAAEDYWTNPVLSAMYGFGSTTTPRASLDKERKSGEHTRKSEDNGRKMSTAVPQTTTLPSVAPAPKSTTKSRKSSETPRKSSSSDPWSAPNIAFGFGHKM